MLIFLIGYRGTGKSTVARLVASRLKLDSLDADEELERRAGKSIAHIFADEGEAAFRDLETEILADVVNQDNFLVVALGGGVVLREENRRRLLGERPSVGPTCHSVVWLRANVDTLASRIAADTLTAARRPNLTASGGRAEIEQLLAAREPHYRDCADFEVDTEGKTPEQVADEIVAWIHKKYGRLGA